MRSDALGSGTSAVEVTNVSPHGLWLLLDGRELFLGFAEFPWFRRAPLEAVFKVDRPQPWHLHWPELDVDLDVASIEDPARFPLVSAARRRPTTDD